jgi:hypothetical protein
MSCIAVIITGRGNVDEDTAGTIKQIKTIYREKIFFKGGCHE